MILSKIKEQSVLFIIFMFISIFPFAQKVVKYDLLQLKGSISSYPIKMKLEISNDSYKGFYYYEKTLEPISVVGTSTDRGNSIILTANVNEKEERINLTKSGSEYLGTWKGIGNRPSLPIKLNLDLGSTPFDVYKLEDSLKLLPNSQNSPMASFSTTAIWPSEMNALGTFISQQILKSISNNSVSNNIEEVLINIRNEYLNTYKENFKDELPATIEESSFSFNSSMNQTFSVKFESSEIIVIEQEDYNYDGGAHGLYGVSYINIDKKRLKIINVKDVILNPNSKMLLRILEKRFRLQNGATLTTKLSDIGLFNDQITELSNIFNVTSKGVTFHYPVYEIAPYAYGPVEIFVPFKDLKGMLTNDFQKYAQ
jgi:hypothetical protein